jgi:hypothetical protein
METISSPMQEKIPIMVAISIVHLKKNSGQSPASPALL